MAGRRRQSIGTRAQVWHGIAHRTSGGLTKNDLVKNKSGRIVSRAKHVSSKRHNRLLEHGFGTKKGKFGFVRVGTRKRGRGKQRGGTLVKNSILSPMDLAVDSGKLGSANLQVQAGQMGGRRSRRQRSHRGGTLVKNSVLSPMDLAVDSGKLGSANLQVQAGQMGGRHRRRHRGGSLKALSPESAEWSGNGISGAGITNFSSQGSLGPQVRAGMSGGRKRRRH